MDQITRRCRGGGFSIYKTIMHNVQLTKDSRLTCKFFKERFH